MKSISGNKLQSAYRICLTLFFLIFAFGVFVPNSWAGVYRIWPLGDSITKSGSGMASYRYYLWQMINGRFVDFVGTEIDMGGDPSEPPYPDFDQAHDGHGGWRADMVLNYIDQWAQQTKPDIVLLHLGTNDLVGQGIASTIDEIGQIIDRIRIVNPNVAILLAQIIPSVLIDDQRLQYFNYEIGLLGAQKTTSDSPIIVVDQWTGFDVNLDTYDGTHPNDQGEQKMANKWLQGLNQILPTPEPIP
jgi:hypothetical protein